MTESEIFNERDTSWSRLLLLNRTTFSALCFSQMLSLILPKNVHRGFEMFPLSQKVKMVIYVKSYPCDSAILHNDKAKYIFMSMFVGLN